mgnify:CR=1 FL=1
MSVNERGIKLTILDEIVQYKKRGELSVSYCNQFIKD